jgi:hypothetical protein
MKSEYDSNEEINSLSFFLKLGLTVSDLADCQTRRRKIVTLISWGCVYE